MFKISHLANSFISIEGDNSILTCDPWIGKTNDNAWYSYPLSNFNDLEKKIYKSKYIYISHLHCDHFDFKTLKRFQDKNLSFIIKKFKNGVLKRRLQKLTKKNIHKLECHIEYSLFKALLKRKFPWNTSLFSSTIMYRRIPNKFNVDMMFSLNFLRI